MLSAADRHCCYLFLVVDKPYSHLVLALTAIGDNDSNHSFGAEVKSSVNIKLMLLKCFNKQPNSLF
ncbi:hypothetical protein BCU84_08710 [Shewanella sp. 10N.286.51.B7]|nr:hypothetical protein BCU84_08710 [Shewanella sp. 10N.286.51.B7]